MPLDTTVCLITLDEAKRYLKVETDTGDDVISTLLNGVSQWLTRYLNRNLVRSSYTEYYNGDGGSNLMLRNFPVYSITSIKVDNLRVFGTDTIVPVADYYVMKESGIVKSWYLLGCWSPGEANIKVVYSAGYTVGESGTMPHDLRLAILRTLDHQLRTGYTHRKLDVNSESIGDQTTTFRDGSIPADALEVLAAYRRPIDSPQFSHAD